MNSSQSWDWIVRELLIFQRTCRLPTGHRAGFGSKDFWRQVTDDREDWRSEERCRLAQCRSARQFESVDCAELDDRNAAGGGWRSSQASSDS
jgi:hypothetical protein